MKDRIKRLVSWKWHAPFLQKLSAIIANFRVSEKVIFYGLVAVLVGSGIVMLERVNLAYTVAVPARGGTLTEGIVGSPRFINPVLAVSSADQDLTELVYSGLMKNLPDGTLVPDLAASYTVATSGLTYDFILRKNAYFSDGTRVTADDVVFTVNEIQDSAIKSPERPEFYDVTVSKVSDNEVTFTLKQPYASFLENLTVGILPKHLWNNLTPDEFALSQYNVEPVGSGPYKIESMHTLQQNMLTIPTSYELVPNDRYELGAPYIGTIDIDFYRDEQSLVSAYNSGQIDAMNSIDPAELANLKNRPDTRVLTAPLPRVFAVFFNQNQSDVLADKSVREALNLSVDRQDIVNNVLDGYGTPIAGPIPAGFPGAPTSTAAGPDASSAAAILAKDGWVMSTSTGFLEKTSGKNTEELDVTISTLDSPDLVAAANLVAADWRKLGANVTVNQYELGDLEESIIRPRKFEALLYGVVVGRDMDYFAFWDSSQRNDPGLNISMYANASVDKLLEDSRVTADPAVQANDYAAFAADVEEDVPAVFLYSPEFIYVVPDAIKGISLGTVTLPYERFLGVNDWYIETNNLWTIFDHQARPAQ